MENTFSKFAFKASTRPSAKEARQALIAKYGNHDPAEADVIIALGGDGFMLETLTKHMSLVKRGLPIYGMNRGTIGFLMNDYHLDNLSERLQAAEIAHIHPLKMIAEGPGGPHSALAFNEVSLFRQTGQAAHIKISVDGKERLERLIADGVLIATPAGSTAYNLSAHGPVLPLTSDILALTPISAFRPRRWRGAIIGSHAKVVFEVLESDKRPVSAAADNIEHRDITRVEVSQDWSTQFTLMFDADHGLDEKILREQFST